MNNRLRLLLMVVALAAAAILIVLQFQRLLADRSVLPIDDFVEYWAAGRLNAGGENPYDPDKLMPLERGAGRDTDEAVMMWNPPWTLTLAMPFGLMDSRAAQLLWLLLGFGLVVGGADLLWRVYGGPARLRWVAWVLAFTFLPTFFVLHAGQIGTWVFAGAVLFIFFRERGWSMLAGASTALLAIKPHLVYLFWIALVVWGVRRDWRMLWGALIAGAVMTAIPLACNPDVLTQYWTELRNRPPAQWKSPTLGSLIRLVEGPASDGRPRFGLTFLPAAIGCAWLLRHAWQERKRSWVWRDEMPMLLMVSFVTTVYGAWPFDLVILLPAAIHAAAANVESGCRNQARLGIICWAAINVAALTLNSLQVGSFWFIWMAPAMLAAYVGVMSYRKPDRA